jgi:hypothetical protein
MLIECTIHRPGGTHFTLGGVSYHFTSEDGLPPHVANVERADHIKAFLDVPEAYRAVDATEGEPPADQPPPAPKTFLDPDGNRSGTVSKAEGQAAFRAHFGAEPDPKLTPRQLVAAIYADRLGEAPADDMTIKAMIVAMTDIPPAT